MLLQETIKNQIKEAMLAKDANTLKALRNIYSAFMNEAVVRGKKPSEFLADDEAVAVIARLAKQRRDSIDQFEKGGREDLAKEEKEELVILEKFLPTMLNEKEILDFAQNMKKELGITDGTKKGMFMSHLMKDLKGRADGALVKKVVDSMF